MVSSQDCHEISLLWHSGNRSTGSCCICRWKVEETTSAHISSCRWKEKVKCRVYCCIISNNKLLCTYAENAVLCKREAHLLHFSLCQLGKHCGCMLVKGEASIAALCVWWCGHRYPYYDYELSQSPLEFLPLLRMEIVICMYNKKKIPNSERFKIPWCATQQSCPIICGGEAQRKNGVTAHRWSSTSMDPGWANLFHGYFPRPPRMRITCHLIGFLASEAVGIFDIIRKQLLLSI